MITALCGTLAKGLGAPNTLSGIEGTRLGEGDKPSACVVCVCVSVCFVLLLLCVFTQISETEASL